MTKIERRKVKLGEICTFKYGQMPRKEDLTEEGYPVFSGYRVVGHSSKYHYREPEIVVVARGVGGTGDIKMSPPFCFLTNLSIAALVESRDIEKRFLFYRLAATKLWNLRTGSAQAQITIERLREYEVSVPPLAVQRRIVSVVSAYDDLIENNQRRIQIVEEMASALYREWFVEFRFPGSEVGPRVDSPLGRIPRGWEIGRLDDVLVLQRGFDLLKGVRLEGTVPIYAATGVTGFHSEAKVKAPGVVTGRSGTIGNVLYVQQDFWPLNTTLWVKEFPKSEPLFAYFLLSRLDLKQFNSGAAVPTLNRNDIHGLAVVIPPRPLQLQFQEIAGAMIAQVRTLTKTSENIRQTRDLLLPRLLSGQIDLSAIEKEDQIAA